MTPREIFAAGALLGLALSPFLGFVGFVVACVVEWRAAWREGGES